MSPKTYIIIGVALMVIALGGFLLLVSTAPGGSGDSDNVIVSEDKLILPTSHAVGPLNAPVTIVEFSDFQCPACGAVAPVLDQIVKNYTDKVRFVYRHFPLKQHAFAKSAAAAAEAAGLQGKFWEMHDKIFENQNRLQKENILNYASDLGLDTTKFDKVWNSQEIAGVVDADIQAGLGLGVNSTPTIYINGRKYTVVFSYEELKNLVDSLISK